jgi:uncharacterized protein (UPF0332 family)
MSAQPDGSEVPRRSPSSDVEMWRWVCELYFEPERVRRLDLGLLVEGTEIRRAQVIFRPKNPPEIRLNGEVPERVDMTEQLDVELVSDFADADAKTDIGGMAPALLSPEDPQAGHVTVVISRLGVALNLEGAGDTELVEKELKVADQFIESARRSLEESALNAFIENAFYATEFMARANLLWLPDGSVHSAKTHDTPQNLFKRWTLIGLTDQRFAALLNFLASQRKPAKYALSEFSLTTEKAIECMETIWAMRRRVERKPRVTAWVDRSQLGDFLVTS